MLSLPMAYAGRKVPALFIFGDSTVDVVTNNFLPIALQEQTSLTMSLIFLGLDPLGDSAMASTLQILWLSVVTMGTQIQQFEMVRGNLTEQMGAEATNVFLSKFVFFLSIGSKDIIHISISSGLTHKVFIEYLTSNYKDHLVKLYQLGARKFGTISIPLIGCCPTLRVRM
ncbi:hypothetical protein AAC387_Pa01g1124 [Persea americana]